MDIGAERPSGDELSHAALAAELAKRGVRPHVNQPAVVEFSRDQYARLQVPSVTERAYIKAENTYFKRADSSKRLLLSASLSVDTSPVQREDSAGPCTRKAAELFEIDSLRRLGSPLSSSTAIILNGVMKQNFPRLDMTSKELQALADKIKVKEQQGAYIPSVSTRAHLKDLVFEVLQGTRDPLDAGWDSSGTDAPEHEVSSFTRSLSEGGKRAPSKRLLLQVGRETSWCLAPPRVRADALAPSSLPVEPAPPSLSLSLRVCQQRVSPQRPRRHVAVSSWVIA